MAQDGKIAIDIKDLTAEQCIVHLQVSLKEFVGTQAEMDSNNICLKRLLQLAARAEPKKKPAKRVTKKKPAGNRATRRRKPAKRKR